MTLHWFTFRTVSWQVGDRSLKAVHRVHRCLGTRQHVPGIPLQGRNSRPLSSSFQGSYNDRDHTIWVHSENISLSSSALSPKDIKGLKYSINIFYKVTMKNKHSQLFSFKFFFIYFQIPYQIFSKM